MEDGDGDHNAEVWNSPSAKFTEAIFNGEDVVSRVESDRGTVFL